MEDKNGSMQQRSVTDLWVKVDITDCCAALYQCGGLFIKVYHLSYQCGVKLNKT